jgi:acyl transferase domain-containing protein
LHFNLPNPQVDFAALPLRVQTELAPWAIDAAPALAGVNSFGFGGTNAHVVLEAAPVGEGGRQRAEGRGQKVKGKGQRAEGRRQKAIRNGIGIC